MSQDPYRRPPSNQSSAPQRGGHDNGWLGEEDPLAELARLVGHPDDNRHRDNNPYAAGRHEPNFADIDPPGGWAEQGQASQQNESELFDPESQDYQDYRYPDDAAASYEGQEREKGRSGSLMIMSVLGLVVLGTLGIWGYRFFTGSSDNGPPPVIKADAKPTKEVPAGADNPPPANKQNYDRATDQSRVVEPEEPAERPVGQPRVIPTAPSGQTAAATETGPDGVRRVRTFMVRPDGSVVDSADAAAHNASQGNQQAQPNGQPSLPNASAAVTAPGQPAPNAAGRPPENVDKSRFLEELAAEAAKQPPEEIRGAAEGPSAGMSFAPGQQFGIMSDQPAPAAQNTAAGGGPVPMPVARPTTLASAAQRAAPQQASAPAQQPVQQPQPQPAQQAFAQSQAAAPAAQAARGGFVVQISSQRTEADARGTFEALQRRFPQILGHYQPSIQSANLGDRGTYYRVRVGPFASRDEATNLCMNLKTAGGDCVVQAN